MMARKATWITGINVLLLVCFVVFAAQTQRIMAGRPGFPPSVITTEGRWIKVGDKFAVQNKEGETPQIWKFIECFPVAVFRNLNDGGTYRPYWHTYEYEDDSPPRVTYYVTNCGERHYSRINQLFCLPEFRKCGREVRLGQFHHSRSDAVLVDLNGDGKITIPTS